jgi:DNA repair exonuclease SbcCD ATPase subunit
MTYAEAVATLHQASLNEFVSERKRLASELKAGGDAAGAARLAKLPRPSVSAWAVNQLWWREQPLFEQLIDAAARVKSGERDASKQHRESLAELRDHAANLLRSSGNAASETTLRRVTTTLSALAAAGGFEPDPPGALSADRDPPGFETVLLGAGTASSDRSRASDAEALRRDEAERRKAEQAAREREQAERERRQAERERLSKARREARDVAEQGRKEVERLRDELARAEQSLAEAEALLKRVDEQLAAL